MGAFASFLWRVSVRICRLIESPDQSLFEVDSERGPLLLFPVSPNGGIHFYTICQILSMEVTYFWDKPSYYVNSIPPYEANRTFLLIIEANFPKRNQKKYASVPSYLPYNGIYRVFRCYHIAGLRHSVYRVFLPESGLIAGASQYLTGLGGNGCHNIWSKDLTEERRGKMRRKSSMKPRLQKVRFDLYAPEAQKVSLVGDFTGWDVETLPLKKGRQGTWNASVDLPPGRYEYRFWVDGVWQDDPNAPYRVENPFGSQNCLKIVS